MNILQHNYTRFKYYIEHIACVFTMSYGWENRSRNESLECLSKKNANRMMNRIYNYLGGRIVMNKFILMMWKDL